MSTPQPVQWPKGRGWVPIALAVMVLLWVGLHLQVALYDRKIRSGQAELNRLRPTVLDVVQAQELDATLKAQQRFAAVWRAWAPAWESVFRQLAATIPPSVVVHTAVVDGSRMTLHGVLRHPLAEPEPYLAALATALKQAGVFHDVTVRMAPSSPDDPHILRIDLAGELAQAGAAEEGGR